MSAPERIWLAANGGLPTGNYPQSQRVEYLRADLSPDPALFAEVVEALRGLTEAVNAECDFQEHGAAFVRRYIAARAILAKLEARDG